MVYNYRTVTERDPCLKIGITLVIVRSSGKCSLLDGQINYIRYIRYRPTRCKMFHSKITEPFPYEFPLKLTDLWITSLLFDLNNKFINGSFAFSPG